MSASSNVIAFPVARSCRHGITIGEERTARLEVSRLLHGWHVHSEVDDPGLGTVPYRFLMVAPARSSLLPSFRIDRTAVGVEVATDDAEDGGLGGFADVAAAVRAIHAQITAKLTVSGPRSA